MTLLIGGHPGSGKTVLFKLCESHPAIELTDEFRNFRCVDTYLWQHISALKLIRQRYLRRKYRKHLLFMVTYIGLIALRSLVIRKIGVADVQFVLKQIYPDATVVGDCDAIYALNFGKNTNFVDTKQAILYRDCRDVAATISIRLKTSWAQMAKKTNPENFTKNLNTPQKVARSWLRYIEILEKNRDTIYSIQYEDLITNPRSCLQEFGIWLGIAPDQFRYNVIQRSNIGIYKEILSPGDLKDILNITGPTMERLGYI